MIQIFDEFLYTIKDEAWQKHCFNQYNELRPKRLPAHILYAPTRFSNAIGYIMLDNYLHWWKPEDLEIYYV